MGAKRRLNGSLSGSTVNMSQYEERESIGNTTLIAASGPSKRKHKVEQLCWSVILYIENYYINIKFGKKKFENCESLLALI